MVSGESVGALLRVGYLHAFIKTPYAKAIMFNFLVGWSVGLSVRVAWTKGGDGFGREVHVDFG